MEKLNVFAVILSVFAVLTQVNCLYFHIGETERKCFIEEVPDETNVIGEVIILVFIYFYLIT